MSEEFDVIVIGGGPAGYVGSIRASQLGYRVACVEKESKLGGTCLRVGCIPSKALLEASERYWEAKHNFSHFGISANDISLDLPRMMQRKETIVNTLSKGVKGLLKKNKVTHYSGTASFTSPNTIQITGTADNPTIQGKHIVIATGSKVAQLPGIELDGEYIGTSTEALSYNEVPEHLVVIGAGVIGLELGSVWRRLGSKVTVLEYLDHILPGMDRDLSNQAQKIFSQQGMDFMLSRKVLGAKREGQECIVTCEGTEPISCSHVLMAVGRIPNTDGLNLEAVGVRLDKRGRIEVDPHFQTSQPNIYAVGDVIAGPMLAHKAEEEAVACIEMLKTGYGHVDYLTIPGIVYTEPEIASVGRTQEELKEQNIPFKKGAFPYAANGRAHALGCPQGQVTILAHKDTDRVLGVHIIGARAGDLIAEAAAAMAFGASSEDIARTCHAHPTLAETLKEAALAVDGRTIHI